MRRQALFVLLIGVTTLGIGAMREAIPASAQQTTSVDAPQWNLGDR
jgi:hypothetical protein